MLPSACPEPFPYPPSPRRFAFLPMGGLLLVRPLATPRCPAWPGSGPWWPWAQRGAGLQMAAQSGAGCPATLPGMHTVAWPTPVCTQTFPRPVGSRCGAGTSLGMQQAALFFSFLRWGISCGICPSLYLKTEEMAAPTRTARSARLRCLYSGQEVNSFSFSAPLGQPSF